MKLVQLMRQVADGPAVVVAAVGPLEDADADDYAAELLRVVEQRTDHGLSVCTTPVESASGAAVEAPANPAELLRAVLSGDGGAGAGADDLPRPDPRG